jgi:hypothetical protein
MKRLILTGILTAALAGVVSAWPSDAKLELRATPGIRPAQQPAAAEQTPIPNQTSPAKQNPEAKQKPRPTPDREAAATGNNLGSIRLPKKVTANGEALAAGTYQLRVTDETAKAVSGETPGSERWVEFVQAGKVKGKELASVVPDSEIAQVAEGPGKPARNGHRVDLLKTQKYWRVWVNKGGNNYLIHLPPAA